MRLLSGDGFLAPGCHFIRTLEQENSKNNNKEIRFWEMIGATSEDGTHQENG